MDQGIAGLVGAGIGAFFGTVGALGAAWLARGAVLWQAEHQADAVRAQWRRTVRRDACVAVIRAANDYMAAAEAFYKAVGPSDTDRTWNEITEEHASLLTAMDEAYQTMITAMITLELEASEQLRSEMNKLNGATFAVHHLRQRPEVEDLLRVIAEFARAAKAHLDD